ncbi:MAG TPA: hypothetical protein VN786_14190 [Acidimicrobiales bacterium]|nr:hypothetical protein [Acidimicrobiales bacterium]
MSEPDADKSTAERVLDLAFYAPLGLALSFAEAVPGLARKGRSRLGPQVVLARAVGQLAVKQGYRQLVGIVTTPGANPFSSPRPAGPTRKAPGSSSSAPLESGELDPLDPLDPRDEQDAPDELAAQDAPGAVVVPLPTSRSNVGRHRNVGTPQKHAASELAIHSYDSLSAPQVVQRLAGLSRDEVAAVRAYEAATRARRTILARAEQLLG